MAKKVNKAKVADAVAKSPAKRTAKEKTLVEAAVKTNGDDLSDPSHVLNRTNGKTKEQIDAERVALIERDKKRATTQHRILAGGESRAPLTEADKKAIAELESGEAQRQEVKTANRIAKMKAKKAGATTTMPLTGKAALSAIAQSATEQFVARGGKITKSDKQEPKMSKTAKKPAKVAKESKANDNGKPHKVSAKMAARIEQVVAAMQKKGGITNPEQKKLIGRRIHAGPLKEACKARGLKYFTVERDGLLAYCAK